MGMPTKIESVNTVSEYPEKMAPIGEGRSMTIRNHWLYNDRVIIAIEGVEFTALAKDLRAAIDNAVHAHTRH
jgi:hypothetical protein